MLDFGVDISVLAKAQELLARPLSPCVLDREEATSCEANAPTACEADAPTATKTSVAKALMVDTSDFDSQPTECASGVGSILTAVAGLSLLQKEMKEKIKSPSHRKAGPPRIKRPEKKVMTEAERQEKNVKIEALEQQLRDAKGEGPAAVMEPDHAQSRSVASTPMGFAERTLDPQEADAAAETGSCAGGCSRSDLDLRQQAELRVRERRRRESLERRRREQKLAEEQQAKQAEAKVKAEELARLSRERVQERLREQRAHEMENNEKQELERRERERAAESAEELRILALKRVQQREEEQRKKILDEERRQAEQRLHHAEANEARAAELQENTRRRMQQHARERRDRQAAQEEDLRRQEQEQDQLKAQQRLTAQVSQQRARARAAEFKKKAQVQQQQEAQMKDVELACERERAEALLAVRQHKRLLRASDVPPPQCFSRQASEMSVSQDAAPYAYAPSSLQHQVARVPSTESLDTQVTAPYSVSRASGGSVDGNSGVKQLPLFHGQPTDNKRAMAVKPPLLAANRPPKVPPGARFNVETSAAGGMSGDHQHFSDPVVNGGVHAIDCPTAVVGENGAVRCTVGFFGLGDYDAESQDGDCGEDACSDQPQAQEDAEIAKVVNLRQRAAPTPPPPPPHNKLRPVRRSTPDAPPPVRSVGQSAPAAVQSRSSSQPPPARSKPLRQPPLARPAAARQKSTPVATEKEDARTRAAVSEPPPVSSASTRAGTPGTSEQDSDTAEPPRSPATVVNYSSNEAQPCKSAARVTPWKQKPVQVNSANYYLEMLKQARGGDVQSKNSAGKLAEQVRQRAVDVEISQQRAAGEMQERGYAVLQRVQKRAMQVAQPRAMLREN